ncbi:hypothetical protein [Microlunatus panaciterrae]|uniref:hypothetical protein n=1 Tax=Microlunatus panaciterrae TaxID=400768 RepID=UPI0031CE6D42
MRELIRLLFRRWYFVLLGAALTMTALYQATHQPGVYATQFNVVLLAPNEQYYPNKLEDPHHALAPLAGVLASDWNGTNTPLFTASGDTTLFGEGRRRGVQVRVPNQGTQWQPQYFTPSINVQVVDSAPEAVELTAHQVATELSSLLRQRQDAAGVRPSMRVTTLASPAEPSVAYISGSRARAAMATGLAGAALTIIAICWFERLLVWGRPARAGQRPTRGLR